MSALGVLGMVLGLVAYRFAFIRWSPERVAIFVGAWLAHLGSTLLFYEYVQTNPADAEMYYDDPLGMYEESFQLNTYVIIWIVQTMKLLIGGSFLDYFMIFQVFGFWGIALLMRIIDEMYVDLKTPQPIYSYFVFFLPGIHFWTSSLGKDSMLFLASAMTIWATMRILGRLKVLTLAVVMMMLIRPHVALVALMALALAAAFDPRARGYVKMGLLVMAVAGIGVAAATLRSTFNLDITSAESVSDFLTTRTEVFELDQGGTAVVGASLPVSILSLLFRPFFFDAQDMFGFIASLENLVLMFVVGTILLHFRTSIGLARRIFFLRFTICFAIGLIIMLSSVYYNVGLGLRQKMMFVPELLTFFLAVVGVRSLRRTTSNLRYA